MDTGTLATKYNPKETESRWYSFWESRGYFRPASDRAEKKAGGRRYVIVIPPPNVTGILHMGHALNNTIQDVLIRYHRMKGFDTLWVPGVDHAGIATQNVVEKKLAKEKKTRHELGREKFLQEIWKWKEEHGNTITRQLRMLGASCDWSRERFTMDDGLSRAVREAFVLLYERGLIYQGHYIINWCPRCQTALSDEEAAHKDVEGGLYHIKYPIAGKGRKAEKIGEDHIVVATTRPETMLGDTAVAVHPEDERYKHLIGGKLILPLMGREIPVIADEWVDPAFGTGFVKVTPAHDPNDFAMGERHGLEKINVMNPDGTMNENAGRYQGLDRFDARKRVIADLEAEGFFLQRDSHLHAVGHCYRCNTVVEPYLSKQWFVRMKPLAEKALQAHAAGKTVFYPERWTKVYLNWLEGIRDWCISRQIWWGHQIPVWYCDACRKPDGTSGGLNQRPPGVIVSRTVPSACPECGGTKLTQDPDVLDTWFSSWLWPFSTLGWPDKTGDLTRFYPTSDLSTAAEIIFFWVARMIMAGLEFMGEVPFSKVYIHGTVRAQSGIKMSKSLGNAIDPIEVIEEIGADALRYSMIMLSSQDVYLSREKFEVGRNFINKIWNASRFVLMNLGEAPVSLAKPFSRTSESLPARWMLSRLDQVTKEIEKSLAAFAMAQASSELYHFIWDDFCDWFIELAKPALNGADATGKEEIRKTLLFVLEKILRLLHPFAPFVSEEIWSKMKPLISDAKLWPETLMLASWPSEDGLCYDDGTSMHDESAETAIGWVQSTVAGIRDLRARLNIPPAQPLTAVIASPEEIISKTFVQFENEIKKLARVESLRVEAAFQPTKAYIGSVFPRFQVYVSIEGIIDPAKERERTEKKIAETKQWIETVRTKLTDDNFLGRAPKELVEKEREKLQDAQKILKNLLEQYQILQQYS